LIIALDFYFDHAPSIPDKKSEEITNLSDLLRKLATKTNPSKTDTFRNVNGVYMKLMNFHRLNPDYSGKGLERGAKAEKLVWDAFVDKKQELKQIAENIKLHAESDVDLNGSESGLEDEASEGNILTRSHKTRERNRKIVKKKKDKFRNEKGRLFCEVCDFDFEDEYGERGEGFIECHHNVPLSELSPGTNTKLSDLSLVCSNCHRMVHRKKPWLTLDQLKDLLAIKG